MLRSCRTASFFAVLLLSVCADIHAQPSPLWTEGQWSLQPPTSGCGSLPLLQVKGPGSIFDASNVSMLVHLQAALPSALEKTCPGAREVILASGRSRKLIKVNATELMPSNAASGSAEPNPSSPTDLPKRSLLPVGTPPTQVLGTRSVAAVSVSDSPAPSLMATLSSLPSLSHAHSTQGKCDVLLKWLESGKTAAAQAGQAIPADTIRIFNDADMVAVFGTTYDQLDNSKRIELYEKLISKCIGQERRPSQRDTVIGGFRIPNVGINAPLPREYAQEFQQYLQLLEQAFQGRSGRFEPAVITQHIQQLRQQIAWANTILSSAAQAPVSSETFRRLTDSEGQNSHEMALLPPEQRDSVKERLLERQRQIAPSIVQQWLVDAGKRSLSRDSAVLLQTEHRELGAEISLLEVPQRSSVEQGYSSLLDSDLTPAIQVETVKLGAIPASIKGAQELAAWEAGFASGFASFSSSGAFQVAVSQFQSARARIYSAALPVWDRSIDTAPGDLAGVAAKREELKSFFPFEADKSSPLYAEFEKPIATKQTKIQARIDEVEQKRVAAAERSAVEAAKKSEMEGAQPKTSRSDNAQVTGAQLLQQEPEWIRIKDTKAAPYSVNGYRTSIIASAVENYGRYGGVRTLAHVLDERLYNELLICAGQCKDQDAKEEEFWIWQHNLTSYDLSPMKNRGERKADDRWSFLNTNDFDSPNGKAWDLIQTRCHEVSGIESGQESEYYDQALGHSVLQAPDKIGKYKGCIAELRLIAFKHTSVDPSERGSLWKAHIAIWKYCATMYHLDKSMFQQPAYNACMNRYDMETIIQTTLRLSHGGHGDAMAQVLTDQDIVLLGKVPASFKP